MNPYMSWAIVLVVAGGLGYYYSNASKPKSRTSVRAVPEKAEPTLSAPKQKKPKTRKQPESTAVGAGKKPEEKPISTNGLVDTTNDEGEDDVSNKEFAKRLAAARSGVSVGETKQQKPRKEKRAKAAPAPQESTGSELSTRAPSSNGADADDDLSSTTDIVSPSGGDVSDMLERPAPGPSVLRLTGSLETKEKKPKAQAFKPVETKKQRQNRQKNEARKQANQEAESERRKLLEKQLHTARESERREAGRKQSATPSNAWTTARPAANVTTNGSHSPAPVSASDTQPLLDTFEPTTTSRAGSSSTWANNLPPEEEQMRILGVAAPRVDEDWTTVPSKKEKAKKKVRSDDSANEGSAPESATMESEQPQQATEWVASKVTEVPIPRGKNHPLDSDWAA